MAVITNGCDGDMRLALEVEVLRPEREGGMIHHGCVALNSALGLVWARVAYSLGDDEYFEHEVLLRSEDLRALADGILQLLAGRVRDVRLDVGSPELGLELRRLDWPPRRHSPDGAAPPVEPLFSLLAYVDTGIATGADGVSRAGPAMLLEPPAVEVRQFGRDLRSETELALCL